MKMILTVLTLYLYIKVAVKILCADHKYHTGLHGIQEFCLDTLQLAALLKLNCAS